MNRVITISREFGSGGRTVGKLVADKLGLKCYDQDIIVKLMDMSKLDGDYVKEESEYIRDSWFYGFSATYTTPQDELWAYQCQLIKELAQKEDCVMVGRCADYILRETADCLNVFIHADMEFRAKRIVEVYGEKEMPREKRLKAKDRARAAYYRHYTLNEWGDKENYDLVLNSGKLGIDKCADLIVTAYKN